MNQGPSGTPDPHDTDLAITAIFLAIPLVALFYAVLAFSVALGAFSIQGTSSDVHARVLLCVVLGILGTSGVATVLFFWNVWRGPRTAEISEEDSSDVVDYGWRTRGRALVGRFANGVSSLRRRWPSKAKKQGDSGSADTADKASKSSPRVETLEMEELA